MTRSIAMADSDEILKQAIQFSTSIQQIKIRENLLMIQRDEM